MRRPQIRPQIMAGLVAGTIGATAIGGAIVASSGDEPVDVDEPAENVVEASTAATATVERRTLIEQREFNSTISYGESFPLPITASGVVTGRPEAGAVVEPGEELLRIDNKPVYLAQGYLPMYRELKKTPDVKVKGQRYMRGFDVAHLQQFLINAGFDDDGKVTEPSGEFDPATEKSVKAWQKSVGHAQTGRVDRSQLIIHPGAVRIAKTMQLGAGYDSLTASDVSQRLTFNVATRDRGLVSEGGTVQIAAPDGAAVDGTITKLERSVDEQGSSIVKATVEPAAALPSDATSAVVTVTDTKATDVLAVPVRALLAVSQGGFAVELVERTAAGGANLVRVDVGAVADGWAEITGSVEPGDAVVVAQ